MSVILTFPTSPLQLDDLTGTAATSSGHRLNSTKNTHTVQGTITDANDSITSITTQLQISLDGPGTADASASWDVAATDIATITASDKTFSFTVTDVNAKRIRVVVTAIGGTATATVDTVVFKYLEGQS